MRDNAPAATGAYGLLAFLTLINVMNFVDRQLLSSFANFIVPDLGLTNTQFGLLTGLIFIVFYAVAGLFMGALADLVHRPRLIAAALTIWSGLTAASGAAVNFVTLAIPRMFIGIGESALTPTAMSLLADRFPRRALGFASGAYYMGVPIGVGVSLLVAGHLGPAIGWRNCFYVLGGIGILLAIGMLFVREERPERTAAGPKGPSLGDIARDFLTAIRSSPALALTVAGGVVLHFVLGAAAFDQLWFVQERGFDRADIAVQTGWIAVIAGVTGNLLGGLLSDWWQKTTGAGRPMFLFWLMLALAPFNLAYRLVDPETIWFWVGVTLGYLQLGAFYGPTFSTVQELAPAHLRSTVVAFAILMFNVAGLGVGITGAGVMVDVLAANGVAQPYTVTLFAFTVLSTLAAPLFFLAGRQFRIETARAAA